MNKKIPLGVTIGLLIIAVLISSVSTYVFFRSQFNDILGGIPERMENYELLDELCAIAQENAYYKTDSKKMIQKLMSSYVSSVNDSDRYMTKEEYELYKKEKDGLMSSIGIKYERVKNNLKITKVFASSPAKKAGLKKGDIIVAFDGIRLNKSNFSSLTASLKGSSGSVNLIYKRGKTEKNVTIEKGYEAKSVSYGVYENVGYIEITDFYSGTAVAVKEILERFVSSSLSAVVLDLRSNESGNYEYMADTLSVFAPMTDNENPAFKVIDDSGTVKKAYLTSPGEMNLPVAVLLSEDTSKAAEIFALSLRDFGKCFTVSHSNTAGDTAVSEVFTLSDESAVLLTIGNALPFKGENINGTGITPDYEAPEHNEAASIDGDNQFLYAVSLLTEKEIN